MKGNATENTVQGLMTAEEAAEFLRISKNKLWSLTNSGRIRCVRIDRAVRYNLADLLEWIEKNSKGGE